MKQSPNQTEPLYEPEPDNGYHQNEARQAQPIFNLPGVILFLIGMLVAIHAVRAFFLSEQADFNLITALAFIPASYSALAEQLPFPGSGWWSPVTYSLLHGDFTHLAMNCLWLAAFGSPLANRIGTARFMVFTCICSVAGAFFHYLSYPGELVPMIGASGAVSGYMGAAGRFAFNTIGAGRGLRSDGPALSLAASLSNRQFLTFSLIWLVINYVLGSGLLPMATDGAGIAWQAHVGGFLAGILLFSFFDRPNSRP